MRQFIKYRGQLYQQVHADISQYSSQMHYYNMLLRYIKQSIDASSRLFDWSGSIRTKAIKFMSLLEDAELAIDNQIERLERGVSEDQQIVLLAVSSKIHQAISYAEWPEQKLPLEEILKHISPTGSPR